MADDHNFEAASPPPRFVRLVLVTPEGLVVGCLPALPISSPWWPEVWPVVHAVERRYGVTTTILRLLTSERDRPHGGEVTYLAEVFGPVQAEPWSGQLDADPLRQPYATPGGPAAELAWAKSIMATHGFVLVGAPEQIRTWNLSSIWRLPTGRNEALWLKSVPAFFAHEGAILFALAGQGVPEVVAFGAGRTLLREVPGVDMYEAEPIRFTDMVAALVAIQFKWRERLDDLLALGLPDWRAEALVPLIADVVSRTADELSVEDQETLGEFVEHLPSRFAELASCGIPDTLVHGDFHPGNFRGEGPNLTLLDWADSGVGHPLLDQPAFLERCPLDAVAAVRDRWSGLWLERLPGSNPSKAAHLLAPIAAARQAVIYLRFLDNIEPSEHPYHRFEPADWLRKTAAILKFL
jgi:Phosphotransferase enzyme family